jgi:hypothetical protein
MATIAGTTRPANLQSVSAIPSGWDAFFDSVVAVLRLRSGAQIPASLCDQLADISDFRRRASAGAALF